MKSALKMKIKLLLADIRLYLIQRPNLKKAAMLVLISFPNLKVRLKQASLNVFSAQSSMPNIPTKLVSLTPRARQIYVDLKRAIEQNQNESC